MNTRLDAARDFVMIKVADSTDLTDKEIIAKIDKEWFEEVRDLAAELPASPRFR